MTLRLRPEPDLLMFAELALSEARQQLAVAADPQQEGVTGGEQPLAEGVTHEAGVGDQQRSLRQERSLGQQRSLGQLRAEARQLRLLAFGARPHANGERQGRSFVIERGDHHLRRRARSSRAAQSRLVGRGAGTLEPRAVGGEHDVAALVAEAVPGPGVTSPLDERLPQPVPDRAGQRSVPTTQRIGKAGVGRRQPSPAGAVGEKLSRLVESSRAATGLLPSEQQGAPGDPLRRPADSSAESSMRKKLPGNNWRIASISRSP